MSETDPPGLPPNFPWREMALAALSEGRCPDHLLRLRESGWCAQCQCWWRVDNQDTVVSTYPGPLTGEPEP